MARLSAQANYMFAARKCERDEAENKRIEAEKAGKVKDAIKENMRIAAEKAKEIKDAKEEAIKEEKRREVESALETFMKFVFAARRMKRMKNAEQRWQTRKGEGA